MSRDEALLWGRGNTSRIAQRDFPRAVLALVTERLGGWYCGSCRAMGIITPKLVPLEIDHKMPLSKGGDNHHLNLTVECRSHNRARGNRPAGPLRTPAWQRRLKWEK